MSILTVFLGVGGFFVLSALTTKLVEIAAGADPPISASEQSWILSHERR
jgi:hypothetical protein